MRVHRHSKNATELESASWVEGLEWPGSGDAAMSMLLWSSPHLQNIPHRTTISRDFASRQNEDQIASAFIFRKASLVERLEAQPE